MKHYPVELQLEWTYNRNAFMLLAALDGRASQDYRAFAEQVRLLSVVQPVISKAIFSLNLFIRWAHGTIRQ